MLGLFYWPDDDPLLPVSVGALPLSVDWVDVEVVPLSEAAPRLSSLVPGTPYRTRSARVGFAAGVAAL